MFTPIEEQFPGSYAFGRDKARVFTPMGEKKSDDVALRREIGQRLKGFAEEEYGSQTAFAAAIGRSSGQVGDWVSGRKSLTLKILTEISRKTGLSLDWLSSGVGPRKIAPKPTGMQPTDLSDLRSIDARVTVARSLEELTALLLRDIEEQKKKQRPEEK